MTKWKHDIVAALMHAGVKRDDAAALRRISMTINAWNIRMCNGDIQRCETSNIPYTWFRPALGKPMQQGPRAADREAGAMKRLKDIMSRYPAMSHYVQGNPRGCCLYIIRPGDVPEGKEIDSHYTNGIAVY